MHDLRDRLPGLQRHAALRGTEVHRAAGRALPRGRRALGRDVGRLLLGLRHLHAGLPAGREDRRDQRAGAQQLKRQKGVPLRDRIITRPTWLGRAGTPAAKIANWTIDKRPLRILGEKLLKVHRDAPAPDFAGRRFSRWARKHPSPKTGRKVVYFHGCGTEYYEPEEGEKLVAILEHNGFEVDVPKQDCCGLPLQSSGLFDDARKVVLRLARNLAPHVRDDDTIIVGNATSCTLMLKREAREILDLEDDPDLELVSQRTYDICELLLELHDRGELKTDFQPVRTRSPTTRRASSRATGSASPRSSCWRSSPACR